MKVATTIDGLSVTARYEVDGKQLATLLKQNVLGYTMGDVALSLVYDTGKKGHFGDEVQTVVSATYTVGGCSYSKQTTKANTKFQQAS